MRNGRARTSSGCASSPRSTGSPSFRWARARTIALPPRRARRSSGSARRSSATGARRRERPPVAVTFRATMGFADVWNKTLVYFGIAEEEEWDEDGYLTDEELQRAYAERPNVRRLAPRRTRREDFDDWTDPEEASSARTSVLRPAAQSRQSEPRRL